MRDEAREGETETERETGLELEREGKGGRFSGRGTNDETRSISPDPGCAPKGLRSRKSTKTHSLASG